MSSSRQGRVADAAVVIVNANAGDYLEQTLAALDRQTLPPRRVIVVDNASVDGSADGIEERHPAVEVQRLTTNLGFAGGNNLGARDAEDCRWVALLNPDAFAEPDWLERLVDAAETNREYSFFASRLLQAQSPDILDGTGDVYHVSGLAWRRDHGRRVDERQLERGEVFSPCAAAALYERDAFLEVGGFDENFFCYFEDSDLSFRLRLAGRRCLYVPEAVVHHVGSATTGRESDFTIYHSCRNLAWAYVKNMPGPLFWLYLPQHLFVNILNVVWFSTTGQARIVLASKRDALRGLPRVLRERRAIQGRRRIAARDLRRQMDRGIGAYLTSLTRAMEALRRGERDV
jgi:GT2 family glycosyltransferase